MASSKTKSLSRDSLSASQLRGARQVRLGNGFVLVQVPQGPHDKPVPRSEGAGTLVSKFGAALKKPGIDRSSVFRGATPDKVYAYSVLASDPTKVVREASDGTKRIGRMGVDGRFKALKTA